VRVAIMDSVVADLGRATGVDGFAACQVILATSLAADSAGVRRTGAARSLLRAIDSLQPVAGPAADAAMLRSLWALRAIDSLAATRLAANARLVRLASDVSVTSRFEPAGFLVSGDSVTIRWRWIGTNPARWDVPGVFSGWALRARVLVSEGIDTTQALFSLEHAYENKPAASVGGVAELADAVTQKGATVIGYLPGIRMPPTTMPVYAGRVSTEGDVLRLVVRGDVAEALRRAHPSTAQFGLVSCVPVTGGLCSWPTRPIEYR